MDYQQLRNAIGSAVPLNTHLGIEHRVGELRDFDPFTKQLPRVYAPACPGCQNREHVLDAVFGSS